MLSTKLPKGLHLFGNHVFYDIDVRFPSKVQPQLEVTPITKYVPDPGHFLSRQIAVNRNYICYSLKHVAIRILNINTALRSLLRGHNQAHIKYVTSANSDSCGTCIDGCVFIRKINEGPDEEEKPQIFERIILALQIIAEGESVHPQVCWHPHKQVKIWEDRKAVPFVILRPHDGNPVNFVAFLTAPDRADHIVLITGGPLNQEVKIWASASKEGWLLPSDAESWQCSKTLTLNSSAESNVEDAFFNQVVALSRAGLFLLANAKKSAI